MLSTAGRPGKGRVVRPLALPGRRQTGTPRIAYLQTDIHIVQVVTGPLRADTWRPGLLNRLQRWRLRRGDSVGVAAAPLWHPVYH